MKQTQEFTYQQRQDIENLLTFFSSRGVLENKKRINLYLPEAVIRLLDFLSQGSRGELVTSLVIKEVKKMKKLPYGMFSGVEISDKEIQEVASQWEVKI